MPPAPLDFAQVHYQHGIDRLEQSGVTPRVKIPPHRRGRREAFGQHRSRAAARPNVKHRIHDLTHVRRAPDFAGGMNGAVSDHSRSVKSEGYRNPSRLCLLAARRVQAMPGEQEVWLVGERRTSGRAEILPVKPASRHAAQDACGSDQGAMDLRAGRNVSTKMRQPDREISLAGRTRGLAD